MKNWINLAGAAASLLAIYGLSRWLISQRQQNRPVPVRELASQLRNPNFYIESGEGEPAEEQVGGAGRFDRG